MLLDNLITVAFSLAVTLGSILQVFDNIVLQFGVFEGDNVRNIVKDTLIYRTMSVESNRESFFLAVDCQEPEARNLLELLFKNSMKPNEYFGLLGYSLEDSFKSFANNQDNILIAEGLIQSIVIKNHPFLLHVGYEFKIAEFLDQQPNVSLSTFLKHKIAQEFARKLRELSQIEDRTVVRVLLKALLYWTLTVYPISDLESAYNYAYLSLIPLEQLQDIESNGHSELKSLVIEIIREAKNKTDRNILAILIDRSRAISYNVFNQIRPEREASHNLFKMEAVERGNEMGFLYKWRFEDFQEAIRQLDGEEFKRQVSFLKDKSGMFYGHFICQNYRPINSEDPKTLWRSLFYSSIKDLQKECPEMAVTVSREVDIVNKDTEMEISREISVNMLIERVSALGHWASLRAVLKHTSGIHREYLKSLLVDAIKNGQSKIVRLLVLTELIDPWSRAVQIAAYVDYPEIFWFLLAKWPEVIERSTVSNMGKASNILMYPGFYDQAIKTYMFHSLKNAESCFFLALENGLTGYGHYIRQVCQRSDQHLIESLLLLALNKRNMKMTGYILKYAVIPGERIKELLRNAIEIDDKEAIEVIFINRPDILLGSLMMKLAGDSQDLGLALEVIALTSNFGLFNLIQDRFMEYIRTCKGFDHLLNAYKLAHLRGNTKMVQLLLRERPVLSIVCTRALV